MITIRIDTTVLAVKYLYKYVYKWHDKVIIKIRSDKDIDKFGEEIYNYRETRYVSVCEACYRIFPFELHAFATCC